MISTTHATRSFSAYMIPSRYLLLARGITAYELPSAFTRRLRTPLPRSRRRANGAPIRLGLPHLRLLRHPLGASFGGCASAPARKALIRPRRQRVALTLTPSRKWRSLMTTQGRMGLAPVRACARALSLRLDSPVIS